jgi:hypothetical protein
MYAIVAITLVILLGLSLAGMAPFLFAIPLALGLVGLALFMTISRNRAGTGRMAKLRGEAQKADAGHGEVEFTDRDQQTLAS